jgi:L-ascorbate metabolism protein UlaG (beta-lactamase superfamily)
MKITKFAQSCILIETGNKKILVDPGSILFDKSLLDDHWNNIDILLVTHKHVDHFYEPAIHEIIKNPKTKLYSSSEVAQAYPNIPMNIVKVGDVLNDGGIKIEVVKAVHGYLPYFRGSGEINENIGFIIETEDKRIYITSDTVGFKNDYKCDILCIPVSNHGLTMGPFDAALFAKETGASLIIPVHIDNPRFSVDLQDIDKNFTGLNYKIMGIKESITV